MPTIIRQATMQDYDALCVLIEQVDVLHRDHLPTIYQAHVGPARDETYIRSTLDDPHAALLVAEDEGALNGFVLAFMREAASLPILVPRHYAVIDTLGVRPGCQRHGLGRALMARAHEWALAHGAQSVELTVYEFNQAAIAFYEALGYTPLSRRLSKSLM
jgi:ribosomal protein S18 acetylase RimI-like enzyme